MGRDRSELELKFPTDIFSGDRVDRVLALDHRVMKQGAFQRIIPCEESGEIKMHDELRFPVYDNKGEVNGLGCIAIEVSDENFAKNALNRAESLAKLGSWRWSIAESCLISCSQEFANILGCSIKQAFDLMHHRLDRVVHPDDRSLVTPIQESMAGDIHQSYKIEYRVIRHDGEVRHVVEIAEPVFNGDRAVEYAGILQDITDRKRIETELLDIKKHLETLVEERTHHLEYLAIHDSLTGLFNRSAFSSQVDKYFPLQKGQFVAVILVDLDNFKEINDYFGHTIGDKVLIEVASQIKQTCADNELAIRLGGDEFAIIKFGITDPDIEITNRCYTLLNIFNNPITIGSLELDLNCSIGYDTCNHQEVNLDNTLANADIALYKAKSNALSKIKKYESKMGEEFAYKNIVETCLRVAINNKQLYVEYQPKLSLGESPEIVGLEALVRWNDKKLGIVPPNTFIPIAELNGSITEIGEFVLDSACRDIAKINKSQTISIPVSVNFSASQLFDLELPQKIRNTLDKYQISPEHLEIEITESVFIKNHEQTRKILEKLKGMGIKILLDDFGTGYSSLSYLKDYKVDQIKLDRGFIKDIDKSESSQKIVKGIIEFAIGIDLCVICEGIETDSQKQFIEDSGCRFGQGYLLGRPMPFEKLQTWITNSP